MKALPAIIITAIIFLTLCHTVHAQEKTVTLVTSDWEPYYGEKLKNKGFVAHLASEAFKRSGYRLIVVFRPWSRAVIMARKGKYHGVLGAQKTPDREKSFFFSDPVTQMRLIFLTKKENNIHFMKLTDLAPYTIGVIRGYRYTKEFDNAHFLKKETVDNLDSNIRKLFLGRIDLIIDAEKVFIHTIQNKFARQADELVTLKPILKKSPIYLMFSRKTPQGEVLANAFNRGFRSMREDGTMEKILRIHGF